VRKQGRSALALGTRKLLAVGDVVKKH
jgi:hypothetical protein